MGANMVGMGAHLVGIGANLVGMGANLVGMGANLVGMAANLVRMGANLVGMVLNFAELDTAGQGPRKADNWRAGSREGRQLAGRVQGRRTTGGHSGAE